MLAAARNTAGGQLAAGFVSGISCRLIIRYSLVVRWRKKYAAKESSATVLLRRGRERERHNFLQVFQF